MKNFFIFIFLVFCIKAIACDINISNKIVIIDNGLPQESYSLSCNDETKNIVNHFFANAKGMIKTETIPVLLENNNLHFTQAEVEIINLRDLVAEKSQSDTYKITTFSFPHAPKAISMNENQTIEIEEGMKSTQGNIYRVKILENNIFKLSYDGFVQFEKTVKAFRLKRNLPAFSKTLEKNFFEEVNVPEDLVNTYFTDIHKLGYFENNKPLRDGQILRKSDLNPINLIRAGNTVEALLDNENISVKFQAISRNNGGLGDRVEIYNPKTSKKYNSKIIDFNKVMIEL